MRTKVDNFSVEQEKAAQTWRGVMKGWDGDSETGGSLIQDWALQGRVAGQEVGLWEESG